MLDVTLLDRGRAVAHVAFRAAFGLMFMQHGAQKLFGAFAGNEAESLASLMGLAGVLEFWGGLLVVVGLGTRWVSLVLAFEMAFAFFYAHVPRGWVPIENGGELAVLYCFAFLHLVALGGGGLSVDSWLTRRRSTSGSA